MKKETFLWKALLGSLSVFLLLIFSFGASDASAAFTKGSEFEFNQASTGDLDIAKLDSTHVVVAYEDFANSSYGTARICEYSGSSITSCGSESVFNLTTSLDISVAALSSTQFVVSNRSEGGSTNGMSRVGNVSGTSIASWGSPEYFEGASDAYAIDSVALSSGTFVISYVDTSGVFDYGTLVAGTVSGSTITFGANAGELVGGATTTAVTALDASHIVFVSSDTITNKVESIAMTISGTSISIGGSGSVYLDSTSSATKLSIAKLDGTHCVVAYSRTDSSNEGRAVIGTITDFVSGAHSYGTKYIFSTSNTSEEIEVVGLDSTHFAVAYADNQGGGAEYGNVAFGTVYDGDQMDEVIFEHRFYESLLYTGSLIAVDNNSVLFAYADSGDADYGMLMFGDLGVDAGEYGYAETNIRYNDVAKLDSTHMVVAYQDGADSNYGKAKVCEVSGSSIIACGSESVFSSVDTDNISVTALSGTQFVVSYREDVTLNGTSRVGNVTGNEISSWGTKAIFGTLSYNNVDSDTISSGAFLVSFTDNDLVEKSGTAIAGTVSGSTITFGTGEPLWSGSGTTAIIALDSGHFAVSVSIQSLNIIHSNVGTISGNSVAITPANQTVDATSSTYSMSMAKLDATHFVIVHNRQDSGDEGRAMIGTVTGDYTHTYGSSYDFSGSVADIDVAALDSTNFAIAYHDYNNSGYGTRIEGSVAGSVISYNSPVVFNSAFTDYISISELASYVVTYRDNDYLDYGVGQVFNEQGGETGIPELPSSNLWKILMVLTALGLAIGIGTWRTRKMLSKKNSKKESDDVKKIEVEGNKEEDSKK